MLTLLVFILGLEFGSFANVCIYRWPRNQSVNYPRRSFCPWCKAKIRWYDNIPLVSYFLLRGRCRECRSTISWRYPAVEVSMAVLWSAAFFFTPVEERGNFPYLLLSGAFLFVLTVTTMIDLDWKIIPDKTTFGLAAFGILFSPFNSLLEANTFGSAFAEAILGGSICGATLWALAEVGKRIWGRDVMGGGDIKLFAAFGTVLGPSAGIASFVMASIFGGVLAVGALLFGVVRRNQYIPFGPFLNLGAALIFFLLISRSNLYLLLRRLA